MWQPNRAQWRVIWFAAVVAILAWPSADGRSLGLKAAGWLVDPGGTIAELPPPLPMSMGDNGDAVTAHDMLEQEYYRQRDRSRLTRFRMDVREATDPFEPATQRQVIAGLVVLGALGVWRLNR